MPNGAPEGLGHAVTFHILRYGHPGHEHHAVAVASYEPAAFKGMVIGLVLSF